MPGDRAELLVRRRVAAERRADDRKTVPALEENEIAGRVVAERVVHVARLEPDAGVEPVVAVERIAEDPEGTCLAVDLAPAVDAPGDDVRRREERARSEERRG